MAIQNFSSFNAMLREKWIPGVTAQFDKSTILRDWLRRKQVEAVNGEYYVLPLHSGRNEAVGSRAEGADLPLAQAQQYTQAKLYRASTYARFKISGWVIDAGAKSGAAIDAVQREMTGLTEALEFENNRQLFGDGSGLLGRVTSASDGGTSWTLTMRTSSGDPPFTRYLRVGMFVDLLVVATGNASNGGVAVPVASPTAATAGYVSAVTATTVTIGDPGGTAASVDTTYGLFRHGQWTSTAGSGATTEQYGLRSVVLDRDPGGVLVYGTNSGGLYGGIARGGSVTAAGSTNTFWNGNVFANTVNYTGNTLRALSLDLMQQAIDAAEDNGGKIGLILCDKAMWRKYAALMYPDRRWQGNIKKLDGGWESLDFAGIPVVKDRFCYPNMMYFLDLSTLMILQERAVGSMDADDLILVRDPDKDQYTGTAYYREQLGCNAPNKNAVLWDVSPTL